MTVTHKKPSKSFAINALQRLYFFFKGFGPKIHAESNSVQTNSIRSGPTQTKNGSVNVVSYFGHNFFIRSPIEVIQDATES